MILSRLSVSAFAVAGFDYVFIDMEHGSYDLETVHDMIGASVKAGTTRSGATLPKWSRTALRTSAFGSPP